MFRFDGADYHEPGFIDSLSWDFQQIGIIPECLGLNEVDAVLLEIDLALGFVKLKNGLLEDARSMEGLGGTAVELLSR